MSSVMGIDIEDANFQTKMLAGNNIKEHFLKLMGECMTAFETIEFINCFISLMEHRNSNWIKVTSVIPEQIPHVKLPPMPFISLLENSYRYCYSYKSKSYIYVEFKFNETFLNCVIKNSKFKIDKKYNKKQSYNSLNNIKESLRLLYKDNYQMNIFDKESEFEVNLKIPI
jgi:LytS/YehU family sensor histidine kinase